MEDRIFKIDDFLRGKLSAAEADVFRRQIEADEDLAHQVEIQRKELALLEDWARMQWREKLKQRHAELIADSKRKWKRRWANEWLVLLLVIALVGILTYVFWFSQSIQKSPPILPEIMAEHYQLPPNDHLMRFDSVAKTSFQKGLLAYSRQDFDQAIAFLGAVDENDRLYTETQYYLGHAYFNVGKFENALRIFEFLYKDPDLRQKDRLLWDIALAQLSNEQVEEATATLRKITSNDSHRFYKNAEELLEQL